VTIIVITLSFNVSTVCNSNGSVNCNPKELNSKFPGSYKKNPDFVPRIIGGAGPVFPVVVTYWILDPAGNGSYTKCDEFDKEGDVIRAGSTDGEHDSESFTCPIDRNLSRSARPVIIKKHEETKTKQCLSLPSLHKCEVEESYFTYRYIPPQLELWYPEAEDFPNWGLMLLVILCISLVFVAILIFYVFYNKRQNLLTLQPQKSSEFYMETPPSEPESAKTETTLPSYHSNRSKQPLYDDIFDEDLKAPFQDVEKRKKTTFEAIKWRPI